MRIGLVVEHLDPRRGGAEQWTFQHAERLLARGHEVHVVTQEVGGPAAELPVLVHRLGRIPSPLDRAAAAEKSLRPLGLDVVHDIGMGWSGDVFQSEDGSRLAQWEQKLLLLPPWLRPMKRRLLHILPRYREFRRLMERQFERPERIIIAVSKMCAADFARYHGVTPAQTRLVYHGTDNARFSPDHRRLYRDRLRRQLEIDDKEMMLLFVGHDFRRKGLATAVAATKRLTEEGVRVRLVIVGGNRRSRRFRLGRQAHSAITVVGAVADPVPYYAAADVFVLPTFYDPCSLSVSEAAASGLPSVTTRFNGAAELLTEGVEGFVLDNPSDDVALAERLRQLADRDLRQAMSKAARELALCHTLDENCDQIVSIYEEIAGNSACGRNHSGRSSRSSTSNDFDSRLVAGKSPAAA